MIRVTNQYAIPVMDMVFGKIIKWLMITTIPSIGKNALYALG